MDGGSKGADEGRANWKTRRRRMRKRRLRQQRKRRQQLVAAERIPPLRRLRRIRERNLAKPPAPFVIGMTRSGTTLLRLMLDSHPELTIPPETHFVPDVIKAFNDGRDSPEEFVAVMAASRRWADFGIPAEQLRRELEKLRPLLSPEVPLRAFYRLYAKGQRKRRWGDKTPGYATKMRRIQRTLPEARFIHMIRDGRDVALSLQEREAGLSTEQVARRWRHRINNTRRAAEHVPDYVEIRYEDLVGDPETTLRRICDHIDLKWSPRMLDYHERAAERLEEMAQPLAAEEDKRALSAESRLEAHALTSEPPRTDRSGRWRGEMAPDELATFEEHAGELLAELGYETAASRAKLSSEN
jgi:sulfotransferase family protein